MKRVMFLTFVFALAANAWSTRNSATFGQDEFIPSATHENGWVKWAKGPVLGGPELGTCFDVNVIPHGSAKYNMYFSWRPKKAIALSRSEDGVNWSEPKIVLEFDESSGWEDNLNRASVIFWKGKYHMWYTGQARGYSKIGYATSKDGEHFTRVTKDPVMVPEFNYEGYSVMNPYVLRDEKRGVFRMWYACGETYEPNMIGYAESKDGLHWERSLLNPIFVHGEGWEQDRIGGCEVHPLPDGSYVMFYIGYSDINTARIGAAISPDGVRQWKRLSANPIVEPTPDYFDGSACYKPSAFRDVENNRWQLWYNGRNGAMEYVGYAVHEGLELSPTPSLPAEQKEFSRLPGTEIIDNYVKSFNEADHETYRQTFPNDRAAEFLKENIPIFECPDKLLEKIYYFRWWTFRKHVRQTPEGYVITEFLPNVGWAGKYNTISCAASHHINEGRWLRNRRYINDYARFWCTEGASPRTYSFPAANSVWNLYLVHQDRKLIADLYERLKQNYAEWEKSRRDSTGLFWQLDGSDGMEISVSGKMSSDATGYRPTINSYMYADAVALSQMAAMLGRSEDVKTYRDKANEIKRLMDKYLWDEKDTFYKVIPRHADMSLSPCRELLGYVPWMYGIPDKKKSVAWEQMFDDKGFRAPYGPTTAEQRNPGFAVAYEGHECQWNGPSWPFATSQTLKAMATCIRQYGEGVLTKERYLEVLTTFAKSHFLEGQCFIDENLNPFTGDWIARTLLKQRGDVIPDRGKDYNHSSFTDLIISDLIGVQVDEKGRVSVKSLIPEGLWDWYCLRDVSINDSLYTVVYDRDGSRYGLGKGLHVFSRPLR